MTNYPKRKNDGTKSITLRREFWRAFKIELKDSKNAHETQRYYSGYALGLFKAKRITGEQYNGMVKRLGEIVTWEEIKKKEYRFKGGPEMTNPMDLTQGTIEAQDALKRLHGKNDYESLIEKMKEKTHDDPQVQIAIFNDKSMSVEIRLVALATLGE